jgi:hypothetical protein
MGGAHCRRFGRTPDALQAFEAVMVSGNAHFPWRHAESVDPGQRRTAGLRSQWCVEGVSAHLSLLTRMLKG